MLCRYGFLPQTLGEDADPLVWPLRTLHIRFALRMIIAELPCSHSSSVSFRFDPDVSVIYLGEVPGPLKVLRLYTKRCSPTCSITST